TNHTDHTSAIQPHQTQDLVTGGAREARRPLLGMARQALTDVRSAEPEELVREAGVEDRRLGPVPVVERLLRPADRGLGALRELHRDLGRALLYLVVVDTDRHEPDAFRLLAGEHVTRQEVVLRL